LASSKSGEQPKEAAVCGSKTLGALAVCACAALVVSLSPVASAEVIVWDFVNPQSPPPTILQINEAGGFLVGDKLFSDFLVVPTPVPAGSIGWSPGADGIVVSGILVGEDYGIQFNAPWLAGPGVAVNTTLTFKVSVAPQWADTYLITGNTLALTASNVSSPDGIVGVIENVFDGPPPLAYRVASKSTFDTLSSSKLIDHQDFMGPDGPVALSEIWVKKDITLIGGSGVTHLSELTQTFSQVVPEPGSVGLLLTGLLSLGLYRWRRRRPLETRLGNAA
jgi:hypothetical protein